MDIASLECDLDYKDQYWNSFNPRYEIHQTSLKMKFCNTMSFWVIV